MMPLAGENFLLRIAQIAIVFVAATSLVNVYRPSHYEWQERDRLGLNLMLEHSFAALFLGLVPIALFFFFKSEQFIWLTTSYLFALFLVLEWGNQVRMYITHKRTDQDLPRCKICFWLTFCGSIIVLGALVLNATIWRSVSVYAVGLIWLLVPPALQLYTFFSILFQVPPQRRPWWRIW